MYFWCPLQPFVQWGQSIRSIWTEATALILTATVVKLLHTYCTAGQVSITEFILLVLRVSPSNVFHLPLPRWSQFGCVCALIFSHEETLKEKTVVTLILCLDFRWRNTCRICPTRSLVKDWSTMSCERFGLAVVTGEWTEIIPSRHTHHTLHHRPFLVKRISLFPLNPFSTFLVADCPICWVKELQVVYTEIFLYINQSYWENDLLKLLGTDEIKMNSLHAKSGTL